jgi:ribosomal protein L7/L12
MADVKALGDQLVELTVKEVNELASYLKETYGIEPAAAAVVVVLQVVLLLVALLLLRKPTSMLC